MRRLYDVVIAPGTSMQGVTVDANVDAHRVLAAKTESNKVRKVVIPKKRAVCLPVFVCAASLLCRFGQPSAGLCPSALRTRLARSGSGRARRARWCTSSGDGRGRSAQRQCDSFKRGQSALSRVKTQQTTCLVKSRGRCVGERRRWSRGEMEVEARARWRRKRAPREGLSWKTLMS